MNTWEVGEVVGYFYKDGFLLSNSAHGIIMMSTAEIRIESAVSVSV